jgi:hypothetical protein
VPAAGSSSAVELSLPVGVGEPSSVTGRGLRRREEDSNPPRRGLSATPPATAFISATG